MANNVLIGRAKVRYIYLFAALLRIMQYIHDRGFKSRKAHIKGTAFNSRFRKPECFRIAFPGFFIEENTSGIRKTHCSCGFVKSFARSIIPCFSKDSEFCIVGNFNNVAVPTGNNKAQERRFKFRMCKIVCGNMAFEMMNRDKFFSGCKGKAFCKVNSHKQSTDKTRRGSHRNVVHLFKAHIRV